MTSSISESVGGCGCGGVESDQEEDELQQKLTKFLNSCIIKPQPTGYTWEKIIGCEDAKRELYQKIVLPHKLLELPMYYDDGIPIQTPGDVLLQGEHGTGIGKMAFTTASSCRADFFCIVNCIEMFEHFGIESSIFIKLLFSTAKKYKRSILYLRNMDCFELDCNWIKLPAVKELKLQMDVWQERYRFVQGKLESLSVIGAIRNFRHVDPAIVSRFGKRVITVPLPNDKQRLQLLLMFLENSHTSFYENDWKILVENTEGYGNEIVIIFFK
jgi:SpoVK/Ycf46/Vps4 family AAA+-type ATPase